MPRSMPGSCGASRHAQHHADWVFACRFRETARSALASSGVLRATRFGPSRQRVEWVRHGGRQRRRQQVWASGVIGVSDLRSCLYGRARGLRAISESRASRARTAIEEIDDTPASRAVISRTSDLSDTAGKGCYRCAVGSQHSATLRQHERRSWRGKRLWRLWFSILTGPSGRLNRKKLTGTTAPTLRNQLILLGLLRRAFLRSSLTGAPLRRVCRLPSHRRRPIGSGSALRPS
jgi:hypothetical protein